jgi:hypothetical protein
MKWTAIIRLTLTPTPGDRHAVWQRVTAEGATVEQMSGSGKLKHRRLVHIRHMMTEAIGKQSLWWGSLLVERPRVEVLGADDA